MGVAEQQPIQSWPLSLWKSLPKSLKVTPLAFMGSQRVSVMKDGFDFFSSLQCTVTCGGGVQTRSVQCLRQGRPASGCLPHQKPAVLRACNTNFCPVPVKRGKTQLCVLQQGWLLRNLYPAKITFSSYTCWRVVSVMFLHKLSSFTVTL